MSMNLQTTHSAISQSTDEAAVRALYQQMMHGWNQGSGEAFAAVFAEDGDLIGLDGTHLKGRQEIARFHQPLFETHLKGTRLVGEVTSVRFLRHPTRQGKLPLSPIDETSNRAIVPLP